MKKIKQTHKQSKALTIMLIPDSTAKVRSIHIPYWALSILGIPVLCVLTIMILFQSRSANLQNQLDDATTRLSDALLSVKTENEDIMQEQSLTLRLGNGNRQATDDYKQEIAGLLAKIDDIDSIKYGIIKVFKDIDALDIPFRFDEKTLSGGAFRATGGAYTGDIEETINELNVTLSNKMEDMQALGNLAEEAQALFTACPAGWPVNADNVTSEFGYRVNPLTDQGMEWHNGIDIDVPYGSEVYATAYGVVTFAGWDSSGYGHLVIIEHDYDYSTYYAHNSELLVTVGDEVSRGQLIALSGDSGRSTGAHCHYEVRFDTISQDPREYLN